MKIIIGEVNKCIVSEYTVEECEEYLIYYMIQRSKHNLFLQDCKKQDRVICIEHYKDLLKVDYTFISYYANLIKELL